MTAALGALWAPSMALLPDAAEHAGLDPGPAFALVKLAWSAGQTLGSAPGDVVRAANGSLC